MAKTPREKGRDWSIRAIGILLLVQAFWLLGVSIIEVSRFGLSLVQAVLNLSLSPEQLEAVLVSLPLFILAMLAIVGALSFFFLRSFGWLMAMFLQGVTLFFCLSLYFQQKPSFIYPIMVYCILMVLYLNSFDVQTAFRSRSGSE